MSDEFQSPPPAPPVAPLPTPNPSTTDDTSRLLSALGYPVPIVALIAALIEPYKHDQNVRFHALQALGLWVVAAVAGFVLGILSSILGAISWILGSLFGIVVALFGLALLVLAVVAAIKAWNGEKWELPLIYDLVKQLI